MITTFAESCALAFFVYFGCCAVFILAMCRAAGAPVPRPYVPYTSVGPDATTTCNISEEETQEVEEGVES